MRALCSAKDYLSELAQRIEWEYDMKADKLTVIDDGRILAQTNRGRLLIEEEDNNEIELIFIYGLYEYIKKRNFKNIANVLSTSSGKYYINLNGSIYTVSEYMEYDGNRFSLDKRENGIIKVLADFHAASEGYSPPSGGKSRSDWGKWIEKYRKKCRYLKRYVRQIGDKDKITHFEKFCLKSAEKYIKRMEHSVDILRKKGYIDTVEDSMRKRQICLSSFKKTNFAENGSGICIRSLNKCRYDIVEKDIAELLLKLVEYKKARHIRKLAELIELYSNNNQLNKNSGEIVKAFILFPEEYEKVCSRHYRGKDKWTEEIYINKLRAAIDYEDKKTELIDAIEGIRL